MQIAFSVTRPRKCFAENHIDVALWPPFKFGHAFEASLFVHSRCLEVVACDPDSTNTSIAGLGDESIQQCARVTASAICLIDPHLFKFRNT